MLLLHALFTPALTYVALALGQLLFAAPSPSQVILRGEWLKQTLLLRPTKQLKNRWHRQRHPQLWLYRVHFSVLEMFTGDCEHRNLHPDGRAELRLWYIKIINNDAESIVFGFRESTDE